ncbi:MAG: SPASM domain-containing protein [Clostridia bacterium]
MPPISLMIKPASSLCNLRCKYCFYSSLASERQNFSFGIMDKTTATALIKKALEFANGEQVYFAFQGGEPLMAGFDYFATFVKIVKENNTKNSQICYALQTNGTLIDKNWAMFFKQNNFLIGLSLDGDYKANKFRVDAEGKNVFNQVMTATEILDTYNVDFNILTVVTGYVAEHIKDVYTFLTGRGFKFLQFIPCLRPFGDKTESELYMTVEQYTQFLIEGFNLYVKDYVRHQYTSVRQFDNMAQLFLGKPPEQCGICGHCSHQFVAEGNGNIYPCDFYCADNWLLGNINTSDFNALAHSEKAIEFIKESFIINEKCKTCKWFGMCRAGGCKRNRADRDYCEAYTKFYESCFPLFRVFAGEK